MLPIETTKKTVRICSVDEEIRIESFDSVEMDDFASYPEMQEVQLVTAKILTAEELADTIARREESSRTPERVRNKYKSQINVRGSLLFIPVLNLFEALEYCCDVGEKKG